ncbi:MAG: hypothetical protein JNM69_02240 [Archangium sp.]|nr:hypothetical protein [Archangium sp.]
MQLRSMCAVLLVAGCAGPQDEVAAVEQAATAPPYLLEIGGASAGSVQTIKATSGTSLCGVTGLELTIGGNFGSATTAWFNDTIAGVQAVRSGAIFVGTQRVAFTGTLTDIKLPQLDLQSSAPAFFSLVVNTTPTICTSVSAAVANQKSALAQAWAQRQLQAKGFRTQIGGAIVGQSSGTGRSSGRLRLAEVTAAFAPSEAADILSWIQSILADKQVVEHEFSIELRDVSGRPFGRFTANGPASALTTAQTATLTLSNLHFTPAPVDGGVP